MPTCACKHVIPAFAVLAFKPAAGRRRCEADGAMDPYLLPDVAVILRVKARLPARLPVHGQGCARKESTTRHRFTNAEAENSPTATWLPGCDGHASGAMNTLANPAARASCPRTRTTPRLQQRPRLDGCATTYGTDKIIPKTLYSWAMNSPLPWFSFDPGIERCEIGGCAGVHVGVRG